MRLEILQEVNHEVGDSDLRLCSQGTYWTIHITPEPEFSYVSFETNLSQTSYDDLVRKVVDVFKPGKLVTTLFVNQVCSDDRPPVSSKAGGGGLGDLAVDRGGLGDLAVQRGGLET